MKNKILISLPAFLLLLFSCEEKNPEIVPIFETSQLEAPPLSYTSLNAEIDEEQENKIIDFIEDHGFVWSTSPNNSLDNPNSEIIRMGIKKPHYAFASFIKNLIGNTTYYVKAFIQMNDQVYYANEISFTTKPGTWKKLKDFPGEGLVNATGFSVDEKGFVVGSKTDYRNAQVWEYDANSDIWTKKKDAPFSTVGPTSFVIDNIGYVYCNELWQYNSSEDSWTLLTEYPIPNDVYKGCKGVTSFVINGKAYIGSGTRNLNEIFVEWDPAINKWTTFPYTFLNPNRSYASSFTLNGKGYIVGGEMRFYEEDKSVIEYDFNNQTSVYKGSFDNDRGYDANRMNMISFVVQGHAYVGMGYGEFPLLDGADVGSQFDFYRYDPNSHRWIPQTYPVFVDENNDINFLGRSGGVSFVIDGRAFMGLGENRSYNNGTNPYQDFWEFIPN